MNRVANSSQAILVNCRRSGGNRCHTRPAMVACQSRWTRLERIAGMNGLLPVVPRQRSTEARSPTTAAWVIHGSDRWTQIGDNAARGSGEYRPSSSPHEPFRPHDRSPRMNRRAFLTGTAGAGILATLPADLLAQRATPPHSTAWDAGRVRHLL